MLSLASTYGVHDPAVIEQDGVAYLYWTGGNNGTRIPARTTTNWTEWNNATGALGTSNPAWIDAEVTGQQGQSVQNLWAPDLSFFSGQYHLYYSASIFEQKNSCIGHATRASMNAGDWADHGSVICTSGEWTEEPFYNAIDPNIVVDQAGTPWMFFGSFASGIKPVQLDSPGARAAAVVHDIAERFESEKAVEAPFVVRRCGYYYLFVSWDRCCQAGNSTYNMRVGRSENVLGPYVDQAGTPLLDGGGTLLVDGNAEYNAAGHNAIVFSGTRAYNVYHAYPNSSASRLRIAEIAWDAEGWPVSAGP
jgi:arabinan endo-1,5-alpha-L-arabinosidase